MKITGIETFMVSIPYKEPEEWSFGLRKGSSPLVIKIYTDEGIVGLGEAVAPFTSMSLEALIHNEIKPLLIGENPFDVERLMKKFAGNGLVWCPDLSVFVTSGVEIALWDIIGKAVGQPVYNLLGGCYRKKVKFGLYLFAGSPEKMAKDAACWVERGIDTIKFKVGIDPKLDIERLKAVREAVGPDVKLIVDPNQAWNPGTAINMINKMEKYDLFYVEQPVKKDDLEGMARIRKSVNVPIGANEAVFTIQDAMAVIRAGAADVIVTDIHLPGGLLECKKIAAVCEAADIPVMIHSGGELGIATAAVLQVVASTPNFVYANDTYYPQLSDDIIKPPFELVDGYMEVPDKPGLGVELDEEKVAKYKSDEYFHAFYNEEKPDWVPTTGRI